MLTHRSVCLWGAESKVQSNFIRRHARRGRPEFEVNLIRRHVQTSATDQRLEVQCNEEGVGIQMPSFRTKNTGADK